MNNFSLTIYQSFDGTIYEGSNRVEFDHFLFEKELDGVNDNLYQISYSRMTKYLESIPEDSSILLYLYFVDSIYLGILDAFINFVPKVIDSLENAPEMTLAIYRYHAQEKEVSDFGIYQHDYTRFNTETYQSPYYGRTIARSDLTFTPINTLGQGAH